LLEELYFIVGCNVDIKDYFLKRVPQRKGKVIPVTGHGGP
jgi:hypothetical protein